MKKAYIKDIFRTINKTKKRFFSIAIITALGVTVLTGVYAACQNMYHASDSFYNEQNLFDIRIVSTTGLTDEDVESLREISNVNQVIGSYSEKAYTNIEGNNKNVEVSILDNDINIPYVVEGELPSHQGELAVTQSYLDDTGKQIGDTLSIDEIPKESIPGIEIPPTFVNTTFTITGVVLDSMDISNKESAFRASSEIDYKFFIEEADVNYNRYSVIYITLSNVTGLSCYSSEYEEAVQVAIDQMESQVMNTNESGETWYIQDRTAIGSYTSLQSDLSSIASVGNAFPILFLVVAILISLTTMTRMIEEERGLIGMYTALGFTDIAIYMKYVIYAFMASLIGGIIGDMIGFIALPKFLNTILQRLYIVPNLSLGFDMLYGIGGVLLFMISIVIATMFTCYTELKYMPAVLMRPRAPRAGSRILFERVPFLWKRLRFLNKVTARNLFRFKKRLFMTVLGIMGCTALVLAGFAIRDSVTDLMPKQYEETYKYDLMVVMNPQNSDEITNILNEDSEVQDFINVYVDNYKVVGSNDDSENVQLIVIPTHTNISDYIGIRDRDGNSLEMQENSIFITQNAAEMLTIEVGDTATLQNTKLERIDMQVTNIVQNYLGNNIYMSQEAYESLFDTYTANAVLVNLTGDSANQMQYAENLLDEEGVLSIVSIELLIEDFESNFSLVNSVVYVLILLAATLAFVVLFTLSNTNIMERNRELATIKVLGFFDREVHSYVNKETLILTLLGILVGLPVGHFLSGLLTSVLKMPSLYFAVHIEITSYIFAAVLSFVFAIIVNIVTNRSLDNIDMVEALKSVE